MEGNNRFVVKVEWMDVDGKPRHYEVGPVGTLAIAERMVDKIFGQGYYYMASTFNDRLLLEYIPIHRLLKVSIEGRPQEDENG